MHNSKQKFYSPAISVLGDNEAQPRFLNKQNKIDASQGVQQKIINKFLSEIENCKTDGQFKLIEKKIKKLSKERSQSHVPLQLLGALYQKVGLLESAAQSFREAFKIQNGSPEIASNLATCLYQSENFEEAEYYFNLAIQLNPNNEKFHLKIAHNYFKQKNLPKAYKHFKSALMINPKYVDALCGLGELLASEFKVIESSKCFELALKFDPENHTALTYLSVQYAARMKLNESLEFNDRAEKSKPGFLANKINRANIYIKLGEFDKALAVYSGIEPGCNDYGAVLFGMASIENRKGNIENGLNLIEQAISLEPENSSYVNFKGVCFDMMKRYQDAKVVYQEALELNEKNVSAINNLASLLSNEGQLEDALDLYSKAFSLEPTNTLAGTNVFGTARKLCNWAKASVIAKKIQNNGLVNEYVQPWVYLQLEDNPKKQMLRSKVFAKENYSHIAQRTEFNNRLDEFEKIKVGYFSSDLHSHATYYLISGLLRHHNKSNFEIHIFSYGTLKNLEIDKELKSFGHHIHDVAGKTTQEIIQLTESIGLDIAVDLKGYTKDNRSDLFAYKIAPVQVAYLGYPGTMGADFIDYMVADQITVPPYLREFYTEKVIFMPHSYQPNDDRREIASSKTTRSEWGLPEDAIVLCCFNQAFKITLDEIDIWSSVMRKTPNSVIWFLDTNSIAKRNLKAAFRKREISGKRVIFSSFAKQAAHLERLRHADMFLDTFFVNAHTSASDALWAGVPVVTKCGSQFASRVAASLLNAVGMEDLATKDEREYEELILHYVRDKKRLKELKERLLKNLKSYPLYKTEVYAKHFENALQAIYANFRNGEHPSDIWVEKL